MRTAHVAVVLALSLGALAPSSVHARDWFVRASSQDGDGSQAKPFADPWQALDKCEANDVVRVTEGKYFGRLGLGTWRLPYDGVQLIGGYDKAFSTRDPWKHPTELLWDSSSKNWPKEERISSNAKGTVVDGVVIDMMEQNEYVDAARTGRRDKSAEGAMRFTGAVTVRNSVIVNSGETGITCTGASVIENNLIVNAVGWGVWVKSGTRDTATVRNNTIAFTWTFKEPGLGAYQGSAVGVQGPANVTGNLFAFNDNQGVFQTELPEKVSITSNAFFMNLFANLQFGVNGVQQGIGDKQMELLEEVGLKAWSGNVVKNPQLVLDKAWMDKYSTRTAGQAGKLEMNDWNQVRQSLGLTLIGKPYKQAGGIAPPWTLQQALALLQPKAQITAGARAIPLAVEPFAAVAAAATKAWQRVELAAWNKSPDAVAGKALELVVAVGPVANVSGIPAQFPTDQHAGVNLYDPNGKGERIIGFFKKGSSSQRAIDEASGYYQGSGKPDRLYLVRGVAHVLGGSPKAGLLLESVEPFGGDAAAPGAAAAARPQGRDWFVVAGSSGGDGSREHPFRDPYQALEKSQSGDSIHVAEGEYFGKLRAGNWKLDTTYLALLGGYDKEFKTRNPWKHPTLLRTGDDYKGHRTGYTIEGGQSDHTGAIIDGFVFDKRGDNKYTPEADLDQQNSDKIQHLWLARPGCIVRNNLFINGAEGAIRGANGQTYENNILFNHYQRGLDIQAAFGNDAVVIRNNTFAFAWDVKFGIGHGRTGTLLVLGTRVRAVVDNNVFEFADNDAIVLNADARDVELTRNTFSHNLWADVQKPDGWVVVDDKTFGQLGDFGFKKLAGNQVASANLPLDRAWFDIYLHRTAMVPGKVAMDDWNQLREILGQPPIARGGKAGSGMAPAYDWRKGLALVPGNPKVTAGARPADLPVKFSGAAPVAEEQHDYQEVGWDTARSADAWDKLQGKRVTLKIVIRDPDNQYQLDDINKEQYLCFTNYGPLGIDSGGLPLRAYVKKGTKAERTVQQAKSYSGGTPDQTYVLKGIARERRNLVVEAVERVD